MPLPCLFFYPRSTGAAPATTGGNSGVGAGPPLATAFVLSPPTTTASRNMQRSVLGTFTFICFFPFSVLVISGGQQAVVPPATQVMFCPALDCQRKRIQSRAYSESGRIGLWCLCCTAGVSVAASEHSGLIGSIRTQPTRRNTKTHFYCRPGPPFVLTVVLFYVPVFQKPNIKTRGLAGQGAQALS
jgi:hypothetical protein